MGTVGNAVSTFTDICVNSGISIFTSNGKLMGEVSMGLMHDFVMDVVGVDVTSSGGREFMEYCWAGETGVDNKDGCGIFEGVIGSGGVAEGMFDTDTGN